MVYPETDTAKHKVHGRYGSSSLSGREHTVWHTSNVVVILDQNLWPGFEAVQNLEYSKFKYSEKFGVQS